MKNRVKLEGFDELTRTLRELPKRIATNAARRALKEAATPLQAEMEQRVARSRVPPHIGSNIIVRGIRVRDRRWKVSVAVGPIRKFFYGFFIEKGTSKMAAQPWARASFEAWHPWGLESLRVSFWKQVQAAARPLHRRKATA